MATRILSGLVQYRNLDIGKPLVEQGFEPESYDVVVVTKIQQFANTKRGIVAKLRYLLMTGSKLIYLEDPRRIEDSRLSTALLDGRLDDRTVVDPITNWERRTTKVSEDGLELNGVPTSLKQSLAYLNTDAEHASLKLASSDSSFMNGERTLAKASNGSLGTIGHIDPEERSGVLWVTGGLQSSDAGLVRGVARTLRSEFQMAKIVTLAIEEWENSISSIVNVIGDVAEQVQLSSTRSIEYGRELAVKDRLVCIPWLVDDPSMDQCLVRETQEG
ncbi:MAG: hypothetical protein Q9164_003094 [Protoblastenia rupestris]